MEGKGRGEGVGGMGKEVRVGGTGKEVMGWEGGDGVRRNRS